MEHKSDEHHISFFKPTTPQATANRNMVVWFVSVWFLAVFGFHIFMKVIEKPTPEPAYTAFNEAWDEVKTGTASQEQLQEFGKSALHVLGKISIAEDDKQVLRNALSWSVYTLTPDSTQEDLVASINAFEKTRSEINNISDPDYISMKKELSANLSPVLDIQSNDIRSKLLPLELSSAQSVLLQEATIVSLPAIMEKYLIHNQSFLTDARFLGFPFHYFYTAVFLLVLFVFICWLYCVRTDKLNKKYNIQDV